MNDAENKKIQLIWRLTNKGFNYQVMAINALWEFLERMRQLDREEQERKKWENREKDRILRRIMDDKVRSLGQAFRQAYLYMLANREAKIVQTNKERGIIRWMIDSNTRLLAQAWNKLLEQYKEDLNNAKDWMKFIIGSLTDKEKANLLHAYNT